MSSIFEWKPTTDASASVSYDLTDTQFGGGYKQSVPNRLDPEDRSYSLEFKYPVSEALRIEQFLREHGGNKTFLFRDPDSFDLVHVRCAEWRRSPVPSASQWRTITATFEKALSHPA